MNFKLPEKVNSIIKLLKANGYEAYAVGGCVRDMVMGVAPNDFDITTSALPEETMRVFKDYRIIETGVKHGTVTVICDHEPFEITTYRIDGDYLDSRHPESVSFSRNLKDDLARRDFTVNTLCYNEEDGLIDLFGGVGDIENGLIRCVGDPEKRFSEDALRIMRALRFSATLGFSIDGETARCIHSQRDLLKNIAVERIRDEFTKLLYDVGCHTLHALRAIENEKVLKTTMFFHDFGKPKAKFTDSHGVDHFKCHASIGAEMSREILKRMRYDNKTVEKVSTLIGIHSEPSPKTKTDAKLLLSEVGEENYRDFIKVRHADCLAKADPHSHDEKLKVMQDLLDEIIENNECYRLSDLKIDGNDLIKLGFTDGKDINFALQILFIEVLVDNEKNNRSYLVSRAKALLEEI